jgi:hypothetical protein
MGLKRLSQIKLLQRPAFGRRIVGQGRPAFELGLEFRRVSRSAPSAPS